MKLMILDGRKATRFDRLAVLDVYESFIWTDRYNGAGDFEISTAPTEQLLNLLVNGNLIWNADSEHVMIIEDVQIETDPENGSRLIVTGRSLESILERRIIWNQTSLTGGLQDAILRLLDENVINPDDAARAIPDFQFEASSDARITALTIDVQYTGDNLYDVICGLCADAGIGWKIILDDDYQFVFSLYAGTDRSYNQTANPYVVFSTKFDNLASSNYLESAKTHRNVALIAGEGEGIERMTTSIQTEDVSGLDRRELFVDARDVSSKVEGDDGETHTMTDAEYFEALQGRGSEQLAANIYTKTFEAEVDTNRMYVYGRDFFMGDIVQIRNEYGIEAISRITEMVLSHSTAGSEAYPTLTQVDFDTSDYKVTGTSGTIHSSAGILDEDVEVINKRLDELENLANMVPITEEMLNTYWNNAFGG